MEETKVQKIKKNSQATMIADELEAVSAISAVADSEGGKVLMKGLRSDIIDVVEVLCFKYKELTLQEFTGLCADMKSKLDLLRAIRRSNKKKAFLEEELDQALLETE